MEGDSDSVAAQTNADLISTHALRMEGDRLLRLPTL